MGISEGERKGLDEGGEKARMTGERKKGERESGEREGVEKARERKWREIQREG